MKQKEIAYKTVLSEKEAAKNKAQKNYKDYGYFSLSFFFFFCMRPVSNRSVNGSQYKNYNMLCKHI